MRRHDFFQRLSQGFSVTSVNLIARNVKTFTLIDSIQNWQRVRFVLYWSGNICLHDFILDQLCRKSLVFILAELAFEFLQNAHLCDVFFEIRPLRDFLSDKHPLQLFRKFWHDDFLFNFCESPVFAFASILECCLFEILLIGLKSYQILDQYIMLLHGQLCFALFHFFLQVVHELFHQESCFVTKTEIEHEFLALSLFLRFENVLALS